MKRDSLPLYISAVLAAAAFMIAFVSAKINSERNISVEIDDGVVITGVEILPPETGIPDTAYVTEESIIERAVPVFIDDVPVETTTYIVTAAVTESDTEQAALVSSELTAQPTEAIKTETEISSEIPPETVGTEASESITVTTPAPVQPSAELININTADAAKLCELPGIGEKTAAAIIEYRSIAPFQSIDEIMEVKGIGEKKFEKIKDLITV